jgi:hypothetical protein
MASFESGNEPTIARRGFFRSIVGRVASIVDEARGIPQYSLKDLGSFTDELIAQIKPMILPNVKIIITNDQVNAQREGSEETCFIFQCKCDNTFVFNQFNGQNTIGQISAEFAKVMSWKEEDAFSYTKDFFLKLVRLKICIPGNPVG